MFVKVKLIARRIRTAESFEAADPWNGGRTTPFRLEAYKLFPEHVTDPREFRDGTMHTWGQKALYGIRSEIDGRERFLPTFLGEAWAAGKVAATSLPGILAGAEPGLGPRDYKPVAGKMAGNAALAVAAAVAMAVIGGLPRPGGVAVPMPKLETVSVEGFLARPLTPGETLVIGGMVPLEGKEAAAGLVVPADVAKLAGGGYSLAWARTSAGHRALLLPNRGYERNGSVDVGYAVVLAPAEVGLRGALEALKRRVPDLDTTTVTASRWIAGPGRTSPSGVAMGLSLVLLLTGLSTAAGFGAAWLAHVPRRSRNRKLAALHLGGRLPGPR